MTHDKVARGRGHFSTSESDVADIFRALAPVEDRFERGINPTLYMTTEFETRRQNVREHVVEHGVAGPSAILGQMATAKSPVTKTRKPHEKNATEPESSIEGARAALLAGSAPEGLRVEGDLDLSNNRGLKALPQGLEVLGSLLLAGCTALTELPVGLAVGASSTTAIDDKENPMIKVTVMYPYSEGARFDHDYYRDRHMPMVKARLVPLARRVAMF